MPNCIKCGAPLAPGTLFCPDCGTPVMNAQADGADTHSKINLQKPGDAQAVPPQQPYDPQQQYGQYQQPYDPQQQYGQYQQPYDHQQQYGQYQQPGASQYIDPYAPNQQQYSTYNTSGGSKRIIAGVIAAVVVLAGVGGALGYLLLRDKKDDDSSLKGDSGVMQAFEDEDDDEEYGTESTTRRKTTKTTTTARNTTTTKNTQTTTERTTEKPTEPPKNTSGIDPSVGTGGADFTVVAWNDSDVPALVELWGMNGGNTGMVNFVNFQCGGGDAAEKYDNYFLTGNDLDVYFCEADWALKYTNDDSRTLALDKLGFTDKDFSNMYSYTDSIGINSAGVRKGASWQACPGGFAYRADLAEQYLGVRTPEEMQAKIGDWDRFVAAASEIAEKTDHKVALADSLGGMWQVFSANRIQPWVIDGRIAVDDSCRTFADYARTLWNNGGVAHCGQWGTEWVPNGQSGSTMGYFAPTWGLGGFVYDASSESRGRWAMCQGPSPYFWGGTWMVVNPRTDNGGEAQTFIRTAACDSDSMLYYAKYKPEYVNNVQVMEQVIRENYLNDEVQANFGGQNYFAPLHDNAQAIDLKGLITPYDALVKTCFINVVTKYYCQDDYDWDTTEAVFRGEVRKYAFELN